jgi:hypothetical protein
LRQEADKELELQVNRLRRKKKEKKQDRIQYCRCV